jgi:PhnB protein
MAVKPIPEGYHTVTPYLTLRSAAEALEFYAKAFGAEEVFRMPTPDGGIAHAEMRIGDSMLMLSDEMLERGVRSAETLGGTPAGQFLYVEDVDAVFHRAIQAGGIELMPPTNMFWGDRMSKLRDPFGHEWAVATHVEDVPPGEMEKRAAEFMGKEKE